MLSPGAGHDQKPRLPFAFNNGKKVVNRHPYIHRHSTSRRIVSRYIGLQAVEPLF